MGMRSKNYDRRSPYRGESHNISYPTEILVGQNFAWTDASGLGSEVNRPIVSGITCAAACWEMNGDYTAKAFMSLDGLVRPVSMDGWGGFSPYIHASETGDCSIYEMSGCTPGTPNFGYFAYAVSSIVQDDLNPLTNPSSLTNRTKVAVSRSDTNDIGHDWEMVGRSGTGDNDTPDGGLNMPMAGFGSAESADYAEDYAVHALRGPLLIQSWGYDDLGYPIPNKNDNAGDAANGIFVSDPGSLHATKFLDGHLRDSKTWAVAPLDIRLNRVRAVWEAYASNGVDNNLMVAQLCQALGSSTMDTANAIVLYPSAWNSSGAISNPGVVLGNISNTAFATGATVVAVKRGCQYFVITGVASSLVRFQLQDCWNPPVDPTNVSVDEVDCGGTPTGNVYTADFSLLNGTFLAPDNAEGIAYNCGGTLLPFAIDHYPKFIEVSTTSTFDTGTRTLTLVGGEYTEYDGNVSISGLTINLTLPACYDLDSVNNLATRCGFAVASDLNSGCDTITYRMISVPGGEGDICAQISSLPAGVGFDPTISWIAYSGTSTGEDECGRVTFCDALRNVDNDDELDASTRIVTAGSHGCARTSVCTMLNNSSTTWSVPVSETPELLVLNGVAGCLKIPLCEILSNLPVGVPGVGSSILGLDDSGNCVLFPVIVCSGSG